MEKVIELLNKVLENQKTIVEAVVKLQSQKKDNPPDDPTGGKPKP
jgi:hypothetical protein